MAPGFTAWIFFHHVADGEARCLGPRRELLETFDIPRDYRTYDYVVGLRAVTSSDGMTADFYPFDMKFIAHVATRIVNEVKGVNRVVYDVTSKPPGTIEWE